MAKVRGSVRGSVRGVAAAVAVVAAVGVFLAGASWACNPMPLITIAPQASGPPGTKVAVDGLAVGANAEIRWNGLKGPLLATAAGPTFSVPITIPDAPVGLYVVVVLDRGANGAVGNTGRAEFLVTGPGGAPAPTPRSGATVTVAPGGTSKPTASGTSAVVYALSAAALVAVGALGGAFVAGRRRPAAPAGVGAAPGAAPTG